ncbi:MAG: hypothetical protein Fur0042_14160 [Cyanophyceae cyanobacterium]
MRFHTTTCAPVSSSRPASGTPINPKPNTATFTAKPYLKPFDTRWARSPSLPRAIYRRGDRGR